MFIVLLVSLWHTVVFAASAMSIGGQGMPCDGNDHYVMFMTICPVTLPPSAIACQQPDAVGNAPGGGKWPAADFTIWGTNLTVQTNDTNAMGMVGLLGAGGDTLTPNMIGQGWVRQFETQGRPFVRAIDRFDFHMLCSPGHFALINGAVEYTVP